MGRIRVAVLMGGRSAEREVSLWSGEQVLKALDPARYEAFPVDTAYLGRGTELMGLNPPDVAFICLHGRYGEDGTVQGMLELLEIPYTGSGVLASALAMNKAMSKKLFQAEGIPTPPSMILRGRTEADAYLRKLQADAAAVGLPAVVKPSQQGSTIGITVVRELAGMPGALDTALAYDEEILVERYIQGVEITAPVLGNTDARCLPLVEIVPPGGFFDYEAKYSGATQEIVPARLPAEETRAAQELALRAHRLLGCRGYSRTDMIAAKDGIWVLEVNTLPGLTATSLLPRSAAAAGISFPELLDRLIQLALEGQSEGRPEGRSCEPTAAARA